jgi:hypothetical protein
MMWETGEPHCGFSLFVYVLMFALQSCDKADVSTLVKQNQFFVIKEDRNVTIKIPALESNCNF